MFFARRNEEIKDVSTGNEEMIVKMIIKKRIKLTFPLHLIEEPVIFTMARKYDVMPNIRLAKVTEAVGEVILELEGVDENIEKGIKFLRDTGIEIESGY